MGVERKSKEGLNWDLKSQNLKMYFETLPWSSRTGFPPPGTARPVCRDKPPVGVPHASKRSTKGREVLGEWPSWKQGTRAALELHLQAVIGETNFLCFSILLFCFKLSVQPVTLLRAIRIHCLLSIVLARGRSSVTTAEQARTGWGKAEGLGAGLLQPREGFGLGVCLSASLRHALLPTFGGMVLLLLQQQLLGKQPLFKPVTQCYCERANSKSWREAGGVG